MDGMNGSPCVSGSYKSCKAHMSELIKDTSPTPSRLQHNTVHWTPDSTDLVPKAQIPKIEPPKLPVTYCFKI